MRHRVDVARWVVVASFWAVGCLKELDRALARAERRRVDRAPNVQWLR